jgi:hypothetical protein
LDPGPLRITTIAALDQELYELKTLGYVGDLHEGEFKQMEGYSVVDGEEVQKPFSPTETRKRRFSQSSQALKSVIAKVSVVQTTKSALK